MSLIAGLPISLVIMNVLAVLAAVIGLPMLLYPGATRQRLGFRDTPQMVYILRIVGTMFAALGLILFVFASVYSRTAIG